MVVQGQAASGLCEPAGRDHTCDVLLLPARTALVMRLPRKQAASSVGWLSVLHLEVEEGCGGDEQYPFSLLVSCRPVQVLEHIQRQGICTRKSKSGTFGPNQELNQVAGSELLLASLPILGSCSAKGFGQSHGVASAVPTSLLFVIMQSLNKL